MKRIQNYILYLLFYLFGVIVKSWNTSSKHHVVSDQNANDKD